MLKQNKSKHLCGFALTLAFLFAGMPAFSQQFGHYLQGVAGIDGGTAPPPGTYFTYLPYVDFVSSLKGKEGRHLADTDLNLVIHNAGLTAISKVKILGATYGVSVVVPFVGARLTSLRLPNTSVNDPTEISDVLFTPVILGWTKKRVDVKATYSFYAPTGRFDPQDRITNHGLGFWENQIQLGTTVHLDEAKTWTAALNTTWEINNVKAGLDIKPGPMVTAEYGLGKKFLKGGLTIGGSGYYYRKLTPDTGTAIVPFTGGDNDQAFGAGPEATLIIPVKLPYRMLAFTARYQPQFGVHSRPQGQVLLFNLTFLNIFH